MEKIPFVKMAASGNDFVVIKGIPNRALNKLALMMCDRKFGIGADGLLLLKKKNKDTFMMRIFNADGSEAEMCGNGARCAALYSGRKNPVLITKAGRVYAQVQGDQVKIQLTAPFGIKLNMPLKVGKRSVLVNRINTGVPHIVIFSAGLDAIDILPLGRFLRYHRTFSPTGTNVNFVEALGKEYIKVRTYERGVEDETLACGTGSVASSLIFALKNPAAHKVRVLTRGKEILYVYFERRGESFKNVWLEGKAKKVYEGVYNV